MVRHLVRPIVPLLALLLVACDAADDVRVQALPSLASSSVEARLGLPELRGPWRFAGWELSEGDSVGLEAELPAFGILMLQEQRRDSLAGVYMTAGGRAPLVGEVRRDSVVSLVTFPAPGEGRFLVGELSGDTLWVEMANLVETEGWRRDARAAFIRSRAALTPFRRMRGAVPPPPPVDSAALAAADSLAPPPMAEGAAAVTEAPSGAFGETAPGRRPGGAPPVTRPSAVATPDPTSRTEGAAPTTPRVTETEPARPPETQPQAGAEPEPTVEEEPEPDVEPEPEPAAPREPPRVLGVPIERDTAGGNELR